MLSSQICTSKILVLLKMLLALSAHVWDDYISQFVCQSVILSQDLEDGSLPKLKQETKCCTGHFKSLF